MSTQLAVAEVSLPTRTGLPNTALMARFADGIAQHGVSLVAAVPMVVASLLALGLEPGQLGWVRARLSGGSPLPAALAAAPEARYAIPVRNILRFHGPNVSPGHIEVQPNPGTFENGWLISGDIGPVDAEGLVFVTGRTKDVIICGAHNIDPGLIESVLLRHPAVLMAAAVGEPDAHAGELPVAIVALKPGAQVTPEDLLAFATPLIAERPAVPKRIQILPAVPMTAVGKVYKPQLRADATRHAMALKLAQRGHAGTLKAPTHHHQRRSQAQRMRARAMT